MAIPPSLKYAFTINVELAPAIDFGATFSGDRRFIAITGGSRRPTSDGEGFERRRRLECCAT